MWWYAQSRMISPKDEALLTPEQIATRLQVSDQTVYNLLRSGHLRGTRIGRLWRIRSGDLESFLANGANSATWRERFEAVLERVRSRILTDLTEEEIEAEIAVACDEAREIVHAARRR